jgi:hypothetical protein
VLVQPLNYESWKSVMADIKAMLGTANEIKFSFDQVLLRANVRDSGEARVAASFCLTICEQFAAVLCLVEGELSTHAPVMIRVMLEGLADLINLTNEPGYLDQIRFENARSDVVLFEQYASDPDMQDDKEALETLAKWRSIAIPIRDELKAKGLQRRDIKWKFDKAGISQDYVAYRVFCSYSHNQLTTLLSRHRGKYELRYHHEPPLEMTARTLSIAASILCRTINELPKFTDISKEEAVQVTNEADKKWARYLS